MIERLKTLIFSGAIGLKLGCGLLLLFFLDTKTVRKGPE